MSSAGSFVAAGKSHSQPHAKGIFSLGLTVLLCGPSILGGVLLLLNCLLHREAAEWGQVNSALIALGSMLGRPLVALAAVVGATVAFRQTVSPFIKSVHLVVVVLAAGISVFFLFRFGL